MRGSARIAVSNSKNPRYSRGLFIAVLAEDLLKIQGTGAVLQHKERDADAAVLPDFIVERIALTDGQEGLEIGQSS